MPQRGPAVARAETIWLDVGKKRAFAPGGLFVRALGP